MTTHVLPTKESNESSSSKDTKKVVRDQAESAVFIVARVEPSYSDEQPDGIMPYA